MSPRSVLQRIDENTSVPLKIVGALIVGLLTLSVWLNAQFSGIRERITLLEFEVRQMRSTAQSAPPAEHYANARGEP